MIFVPSDEPRQVFQTHDRLPRLRVYIDQDTYSVLLGPTVESYAHQLTVMDISQQLCMSERTVRRYINMFEQTGKIEPRTQRNFEQLVVLRMILLLLAMFGVCVSAATICRT